MNTKELTTLLTEAKAALLIEQREYVLTLPPKVRDRSSCNRRPHGGWGVPGNAKWTRAMKAAGCPIDNFWSGHAPTPSTQMPHAFSEFLNQIDL